MTIKIELTKDDLKRLVIKELQERLGDQHFDPANVSVETKSKQNYKAEWETADFRATYLHTI